MADRQNDQRDEHYSEQDSETDTRGQKGGTSQQDYRESESDMDERGETDEEMNEGTSGW